MVTLDLRGVPCPLNFVRTKLRLEQMAVGDRLEVWLDAGEPIQQVPSSLEVAGHRVVELEEQPDGYFMLLAERGRDTDESKMVKS
ncbi:sulfurtransferase TusA family protein [Synechococcus sp. PCC 7336]|uniref:sulfurtransferase TusA family protein n=1 Tax=Synechococcus sp. PCC 7336 TaxID=195250 RepID=UPI000349A658|nr:sulfurtransferase TusA family protein [Synechococcus sp. PCC 7336]